MQLSRRALAAVVFVAVLSNGYVDPAGAQTGNGGSAFALQPGVEIARHRETGLVTWMSGPAGQPAARGIGQGAGGTPEQAAVAFLSSQAQAFGLRSGSPELAVTRSEADQLGRTFVRFQQNYRNLPIIGAELNVQVDAGRNVLSVNGKTVGDINLSTQPDVSADDAARIALTFTGRAHHASVDALRASKPVLSVHDARILGGRPAAPALVWRVDVTSATRLEIHEIVLVNAHTGRVAVQFNQRPHAAPPANAAQRVCDAVNTPSKVPCRQAAQVNSPGSSNIADVKNAFRFAENTYDFYARRFNRNSLDNKGLKLVSTTRYRDPSDPGNDYTNAFWSSDLRQMVYGKDYASARDVVGHELSHGFTSFTSNLIYYYQSGALNESLSDVFGELVQRSSESDSEWQVGEDLPIGAIRSMKDPTLFGDPDKMTSTNWTGDFSFFDQGGVHTNSGVGNKTAFLISQGGTFNGQTISGIGDDKTAAIYYRVNSMLLTSSSDYADLGNALRQACKDLTGTRPKNKNGNPGSRLTAANCRQVGKAIAAAELSKDPQFWPIPAEAPVCGAGRTVSSKSFDNFEEAQARFKYVPSDGTHWFVIDNYAASNTHSIRAAGSGQFDTNVRSKRAITIPAKAFLHFAHFYNLAPGHAGGVVEYRIGNGPWQRVKPGMFLNNSYNTTLLTGTGNVLEGNQAFSGFSSGWTSSRINLSRLRGKSVRFRFRLATDSFGAGDSWILDDIRIYQCKPRSSPEVAVLQYTSTPRPK